MEDTYESLKKMLEGMRYVEGEDVLEKQIGDMLRRKGVTIATAESCTGGEIAHMITSVPEVLRILKGVLLHMPMK